MGVRLFSAVAGIALVIAAVFFLRYSIEQGWLQPPVRVAIGVLTGLSLLVVCERKAARRYAVTANALDAAAVSILFATFFAAHALWQLIPALPTFLLLALVAAVAVLLSIRHESLFIAVLGLLGGFSTPALLSTGENRPIPLFAYLLLLNLGLAWVARARGWPLLTGLSLALTTLYQWGWVLKFLDAPQVPLAAGIFLVLPAASLGVLVLARRRSPGTAADRSLQDTALLGATLPLLFTLYLAAVPGYGARFGILFGFLFLVDASLLAIALARREYVLHLAGGLGTLLTFAVWLTRSYTTEAWPAVLGAVAVSSVSTSSPSRSPDARAARRTPSSPPPPWRRRSSWPPCPPSSSSRPRSSGPWFSSAWPSRSSVSWPRPRSAASAGLSTSSPRSSC